MNTRRDEYMKNIHEDTRNEDTNIRIRIRIYEYTNTRIHEETNIRIHEDTNTRMHEDTNIRIHEYTDITNI